MILNNKNYKLLATNFIVYNQILKITIKCSKIDYSQFINLLL